MNQANPLRLDSQEKDTVFLRERKRTRIESSIEAKTKSFETKLKFSKVFVIFFTEKCLERWFLCCLTLPLQFRCVDKVQ